MTYSTHYFTIASGAAAAEEPKAATPAPAAASTSTEAIDYVSLSDEAIEQLTSQVRM